MIQKKIALLGAPGVGKTSLVRRFVTSIFDDKYLTTIGVKIDKKQVQSAGQDVMLMLWDVAGAEENFAVPTSYVRGASGYLLVVDGTRPETLDVGLDIVEQINGELGSIPFIPVYNKIDLTDQWKIKESDVSALTQLGLPSIRTSAKTGDGVEDAFMRLAHAMIR